MKKNLIYALFSWQLVSLKSIEAYVAKASSTQINSSVQPRFLEATTKVTLPLRRRLQVITIKGIKAPQLYSSVPKDEESYDLSGYSSFFNEEVAKSCAPELLQKSSWASIISVALLITGNTVGAGTMVLPQVAGTVGMAYVVPMFMALYIINMLSGTIISEVAIQQFERQTSESEIKDPSSLKDLSDITLGKVGGNLIAGTSIFANWCGLSYCLMRSGELINHISGDMLDTSMIAISYSALVAGLVTTLSNHSLSKISSAAVAVLFASFAGLIIPGLTAMQDPLLTLMAPGTFLENGGDTTPFQAIMAAVPIVLECMIFQNIVPTVTKMLNFDRFAVRTAMMIGSGIPVLMYLSWCFMSLGGGIEDLGNMDMTLSLLHAFGMASVVGSSVAGTMGLSNEFSSFLSRIQAGDDKFVSQAQSRANADHSIVSVALALTPPLLAGLAFSGGECFTLPLSLSGQFGSPILYGIAPVMMTLKQGMDCAEKTPKQAFMYKSIRVSKASQVKLPGEFIGLASLGACSLGYIGQQMFLTAFT